MPRRRRRAYPSDLTKGQWALIAPMIPDASPGGRPRRAAKREIVDAILYFLRAGCSWRLFRFNEGGPGALVTRKVPGKTPILTGEQRAALTAAVEAGSRPLPRRRGALATDR